MAEKTKETSEERVKKMAADLKADEVDKRIKIVEMIADTGFGGGEMHVLGLLQNLDKEKFEPFLICSPGVLANNARSIEGLKIYEIKFRSKFDFSSTSKLEKILSEIQTHENPFRPMIVHTHGPRAGFIGRRATPRGVYKVYTEHIWNEAYHLENRVNEWVQKRALRSLNHKTDMVIAVSNAVRDFLVKSDLVPEKRVRVIPNGIELAETVLDSRLRGNDKFIVSHGHNPPLIGTVGNLNSQKGHQYLIEAMPEILKSYPHLTLEIIGEGEERESLEKIIDELNLKKHVTLLGGNVSRERIESKWDIFVLPSISETFGIVILEAMKLGLPVVASKVGGVTDIVKEGKNGLLIKSKNPSAIASAVLELLNHPALAAKLVREGKETIKKFDWKVVIKDIEEVYLNLAKDKF